MEVRINKEGKQPTKSDAWILTNKFNLIFSRPFEYFILTCIILNCVALGANTPYPNKDNDATNEMLVSRREPCFH